MPNTAPISLSLSPSPSPSRSLSLSRSLARSLLVAIIITVLIVLSRPESPKGVEDARGPYIAQGIYPTLFHAIIVAACVPTLLSVVVYARVRGCALASGAYRSFRRPKILIFYRSSSVVFDPVQGWACAWLVLWSRPFCLACRARFVAYAGPVSHRVKLELTHVLQMWECVELDPFSTAVPFWRATHSISR